MRLHSKGIPRKHEKAVIAYMKHSPVQSVKGVPPSSAELKRKWASLDGTSHRRRAASFQQADTRGIEGLGRQALGV